MFKPDKANGIEIQSEHEAKFEKERREKEAALLATPGGRNRYHEINSFMKQIQFRLHVHTVYVTLTVVVNDPHIM